MYAPDATILAKYADLLVKFALNSGRGVKKGDVVQVNLPDVSKPLYVELMRAILECGGHPKMQLLATDVQKQFFDHASDDQLAFFPEAYKRAEADLIDHQISIIAESDPRELSSVEPDRVFRALDARRKFRDWLFEKENQGKFTWTLGLYGTDAMAREAGMSTEEYWNEIIHACYLDTPDPVAEWRKIQKEQERLKKVLNAMQIQKLHVEAERIDLWIGVGADRQWLGGSGRNIPSYELFVSPDWRGTEGTIFFNQPLYRYGNILRNITLRFEKGIVVEAKAEEGQAVLESMIRRENADKVGEFSLTDKRFSRITKFMANTLYDENVGGEFGNTHVALGTAYKESFTGDLANTTKEEFARRGFNESPEHTDIISTEDRTVTAFCGDGTEKVIFRDGIFTI